MKLNKCGRPVPTLSLSRQSTRLALAVIYTTRPQPCYSTSFPPSRVPLLSAFRAVSGVCAAFALLFITNEPSIREDIVMLRPLSTKRLLTPNLLRADSRYISSTIIARSHQPNAPVELDPSYASLLKDTDMSIHRHKARQTIPDSHRPQVTSLRELEIFPSDSVDDHLTFEELEDQEAGQSRTEQKSPAAVFGSQRIGAVILPFELNQTITRLISGVHVYRSPAVKLLMVF